MPQNEGPAANDGAQDRLTVIARVRRHTTETGLTVVVGVLCAVERRGDTSRILSMVGIARCCGRDGRVVQVTFKSTPHERAEARAA